MPPIRPPVMCPGTPRRHVLAQGTVLRRVHPTAYAADSFNPTPQPSVLSGGRFDSLDGAFSYSYLADDDDGAIAETMCRELPLDGRPRLIPRIKLAGRVITSVELLRDLTLVSLRGADLSQVGQDIWLTKCEADGYLLTREWSESIRAWCSDAAGFVYRCRHDEDCIAYVLFDDGATAIAPRARSALHARSDSIPLDSVAGEYMVRRVALRHNATLA
jgi:hypothetical protein